MGFSEEVRNAIPALIEERRYLHENAEVSFFEFRTTEWLEKALTGLPGVTVERPTKTGLVAHVTGTKPGNKHVVGIRADIDALPMTEETPVPFASKNPGAMHACGHDGHTAILLEAVKALAASRESFCGEVRCFFQHAEELPPGGAIEMVRAGCAEGVEAMLALHLSSNFPTGAHGIRAGVLTANVDKFGITLTGKGGHCAFPEQAKDPVVAAAELVTALQTVVSRKLPANEPAVVSVCSIHGGSAYNIIPDSVELWASVRSFGEKTRETIEREVTRLAEGIALANGLTASVDYERGYPSVVNDPVLAALAKRSVTERFGEGRVFEIGTIMPGEDFSYFVSEKVPGFFLELGSGNAEKGCAFPHHNVRYCMDEDALPYGLQFELDMIRTLLDGMGEAVALCRGMK